MTILNRLLAVLTIMTCTQIFCQESNVERLKKLGYDKWPETLNKLQKKTVYRQPTELELRFAQRLPTVPMERNAFVHYVRAGLSVVKPDSKGGLTGTGAPVGKYDADLKMLAKWLDKNSSALEHASAARTLENFEYAVAISTNEDLNALTNFQDQGLSTGIELLWVSRLLLTHGLYCEERGLTNQALDHYLHALDVIGLMVKHPYAHYNNWAVSGRRYVFEALERLVGTQRLTTQQLAHLQKKLETAANFYTTAVIHFKSKKTHRWSLLLDRKFLAEWKKRILPKMVVAAKAEQKKVDKARKRDEPSAASRWFLIMHNTIKDRFEGYMDLTDAERKVIRELLDRELLPQLDAIRESGLINANDLSKKKLQAVVDRIVKLFPDLEDALWKFDRIPVGKLAARFGKHLPKEECLEAALRLHWEYSVHDTMVRICRKAVESRTRKDLCITRVALERYRQKHNRYPDTLNDLVPTFIKAVPKDLQTGNPLIYRIQDQNWVLYSVGSDGNDDGGKDIGLQTNARNKDYGIRSFTVSNSEHRRGLGPVLLQAHKDDVKSSTLLEARMAANAFVKYNGVWIKKDLAEKRRERDKVGK